MTRKPSVHVFSNPKSGWSVKKEGASRAAAVVPTQKEAIVKARSIGKTEKLDVVIHRKDGLVEKKIIHKVLSEPVTRKGPKR